MARRPKVRADLSIRLAMFGLDVSPKVVASRALQVVTTGSSLPAANVDRHQRLYEAARQLSTQIGVQVNSDLQLVDFHEQLNRQRNLEAWYLAVAPLGQLKMNAKWTAVGRSPKLELPSNRLLKTALEELRSTTKTVDGATSLLGKVFTVEDLLRLYAALHGGHEVSERTFRRRVQELCADGILQPLSNNESIAMREDNQRFQSRRKVGGRPPEILRYMGGGESEQLIDLRARR